MVARERACDYTWAETPGRVQAATGVEDSNHLSDEKRQANTDRCKESGFVLLGCEHEDSDDEQRGEEHLHEDTLCDGHTNTEGCRDVEIAREHGRDDSCGTYACKHLRDKAENGTHGSESADEVEAEGNLNSVLACCSYIQQHCCLLIWSTYSWIEQSTADLIYSQYV